MNGQADLPDIGFGPATPVGPDGTPQQFSMMPTWMLVRLRDRLLLGRQDPMVWPILEELWIRYLRDAEKLVCFNNSNQRGTDA